MSKQISLSDLKVGYKINYHNPKSKKDIKNAIVDSIDLETGKLGMHINMSNKDPLMYTIGPDAISKIELVETDANVFSHGASVHTIQADLRAFVPRLENAIADSRELIESVYEQVNALREEVDTLRQLLTKKDGNPSRR